jgi:hypothetical protein
MEENMIRVYLYIILISLVMAGCNNQDASKKPEGQSGDVDQGISDTKNNNPNPEEALLKEIQMMGKRDFRKTTWGMDRATVKLTEADDPASEDDSAIIYPRKIAGMDALLGYIFEDDKLVRAKYMFRQQHSDLNDYITDHKNMKKALEKKYGKAKKERTIWTNDLYTKIPSQWGIALGQGYLTYISSWNAKNSEIILTLKGQNDKIDLWLEFYSKAFAKSEKSSKEK